MMAQIAGRRQIRRTAILAATIAGDGRRSVQGLPSRRTPVLGIQGKVEIPSRLSEAVLALAQASADDDGGHDLDG